MTLRSGCGVSVAVWVAMVFLGSGVLQAQQAQNALVVEGGTLIDGTGAPPRPIRGLVVVGDRIQEIVPAGGTLHAPAGARTVHADGLTIVPGLFDSHVHYRGDDA